MHRFHRARRLAEVAVPPLVLLVLLLVLWYVVRWSFFDDRERFLLPAAHEVVSDGFLNGENRREIVEAALVTGRVALLGLVLATGIGVSFAVTMSLARWARRSFYPYAVILQTTPILAIAPLIGLWFEYGFRSRVIVCVIVALFPIITNTLSGLDSVDDAEVDLFRLMGTARLVRLVKLDLITALPSMFTGLRIAATWSVVGAVVADFFFGQGGTGLGRLLDLYRGDLAGEQLFATVIAACALGLLFVAAVVVLTRVCIGSWHQSEQVAR